MTALRIIGAVRLFPLALPVWLFYLLPCWALGWYQRIDVLRDVPGVVFEVTDRAPRWLLWLWNGAGTRWRWRGHAMLGAVVLHGLWSEDTLRHEAAHLDQAYALGVLVLPVYLLLLAMYGYRGHPMEVHAREVARR